MTTPAPAPPPGAPQQPTPAPAPDNLNLDNIQGDIVLGLPKRFEEFVFFVIADVAGFRKKLRDVIPCITTTRQVLNDLARIAEHKKTSKGPDDLISMDGANIAFSSFGTQKMGFAKGSIGDPDFDNGQASVAPLVNGVGLGDNTTTLADNTVVLDWEKTFLTQLDGVILLTGESDYSCRKRREQIVSILANTIQVIDIARGKVRPGVEKGHEHFGFHDGISQPFIAGFGSTPLKGQDTIPSGITIIGHPGDTATRPPFAVDGSFLAFRKLRQFVPEFNAFLLKNGAFDGLTPQEGADLLGARLIGRWKSGLSVDLSPLKDDPVEGNDPNRNNDFRYTFTNPDDQTDQTRCPFAAHLRKTNPRADLDNNGGTELRRIFRQGIPYGEEVTNEEKALSKTDHDRGLLFVSYQSVIGNGFQFIQEKWVNNTGFIFGKSENPGLDMIIGQNGGQPRSMVGFDPKAQTTALTSTIQFVESRGGEYFFSPSISALKDFFSTA